MARWLPLLGLLGCGEGLYGTQIGTEAAEEALENCAPESLAPPFEESTDGGMESDDAATDDRGAAYGSAIDQLTGRFASTADSELAGTLLVAPIGLPVLVIDTEACVSRYEVQIDYVIDLTDEAVSIAGRVPMAIPTALSAQFDDRQPGDVLQAGSTGDLVVTARGIAPQWTVTLEVDGEAYGTLTVE